MICRGSLGFYLHQEHGIIPFMSQEMRLRKWFSEKLAHNQLGTGSTNPSEKHFLTSISQGHRLLSQATWLSQLSHLVLEANILPVLN